MNKPVKEFSNRRGNVKITFDGIYFCVSYTLYSNFKTKRPQKTTEFAKLDALFADKYFQAAINELKGGNWVEPVSKCTYCAKKIKACERDKCPSDLGGTSYWDIFSANCPYHRGHTR